MRADGCVGPFSFGEQPLTLGEGKTIDADLPSRRADTASEAALFRFDDAAQSWVFVSKVPRIGSKTGKPIPNAQVDPGEPVYRAKLDRLGWWAVGEFFDELSCVHACVVDADGKGVPFARAIATGVDHFTQLTTYADEQGCFALDVRAKAQISVSVQASAGYAPGKVFETGDSGPSVAQGIDACQDLGTFTLAKQGADDCPLGLRACGAACVDTRADRANCGKCDNTCGGSAGRELSCVAGVCECAFGQRDCSGEYCAASQTDDANCGGCGIVCTGDSRCSEGMCTGKEDPVADAGVDGGVGVDIVPDGGPAGLPMLTVSPARQAFGPTLIGEQSAVFRFTFTNTGSATATACSAPTLAGKHASEFTLSGDTCGTNDLAAKATCTIDVAVTPGTTGERTATLARACAERATASTVAEGLSVNRPHYLFVTSTESAGNLGGLAGADMRCNDRAAVGSLTSSRALSWRALLSIKDTVDARNRITFTGPVYDVRDLLATNDPTVWPWTVDGTSADPQLLGVDENGTQARSYVWTGTNSSGVAKGADCNGWTSNSNTLMGQYGETGNFSGTSTTWVDSLANGCSDTFFSLMCISDGPL